MTRLRIISPPMSDKQKQKQNNLLRTRDSMIYLYRNILQLAQDRVCGRPTASIPKLTNLELLQKMDEGIKEAEQNKANNVRYYHYAISSETFLICKELHAKLISLIYTNRLVIARDPELMKKKAKLEMLMAPVAELRCSSNLEHRPTTKIFHSESPATFTPPESPESSTNFDSPTSFTPSYLPTSSEVVDLLANSTILDSPASSTILDSPASSTILDSPASSTILDSPASSTILDSPASSTILDSPASSTILDSPASSTISNSPASSTISDPPASSTISDSPASYTPSDSQEDSWYANLNIEPIFPLDLSLNFETLKIDLNDESLRDFATFESKVNGPCFSGINGEDPIVKDDSILTQSSLAFDTTSRSPRRNSDGNILISNCAGEQNSIQEQDTVKTVSTFSTNGIDLNSAPGSPTLAGMAPLDSYLVPANIFKTHPTGRFYNPNEGGLFNNVLLQANNPVLGNNVDNREEEKSTGDSCNENNIEDSCDENVEDCCELKNADRFIKEMSDDLSDGNDCGEIPEAENDNDNKEHISCNSADCALIAAVSKLMDIVRRNGNSMVSYPPSPDGSSGYGSGVPSRASPSASPSSHGTALKADCVPASEDFLALNVFVNPNSVCSSFSSSSSFENNTSRENLGNLFNIKKVTKETSALRASHLSFLPSSHSPSYLLLTLSLLPSLRSPSYLPFTLSYLPFTRPPTFLLLSLLPSFHSPFYLLLTLPSTFFSLSLLLTLPSTFFSLSLLPSSLSPFYLFLTLPPTFLTLPLSSHLSLTQRACVSGRQTSTEGKTQNRTQRRLPEVITIDDGEVPSTSTAIPVMPKRSANPNVKKITVKIKKTEVLPAAQNNRGKRKTCDTADINGVGNGRNKIVRLTTAGNSNHTQAPPRSSTSSLPVGVRTESGLLVHFGNSRINKVSIPSAVQSSASQNVTKKPSRYDNYEISADIYSGLNLIAGPVKQEVTAPQPLAPHNANIRSFNDITAYSNSSPFQNVIPKASPLNSLPGNYFNNSLRGNRSGNRNTNSVYPNENSNSHTNSTTKKRGRKPKNVVETVSTRSSGPSTSIVSSSAPSILGLNTSGLRVSVPSSSVKKASVPSILIPSTSGSRTSVPSTSGSKTSVPSTSASRTLVRGSTGPIISNETSGLFRRPQGITRPVTQTGTARTAVKRRRPTNVDPAKREAHNASERLRRQELTNAFGNVREFLLEREPGQRFPKVRILTTSVMQIATWFENTITTSERPRVRRYRLYSPKRYRNRKALKNKKVPPTKLRRKFKRTNSKKEYRKLKVRVRLAAKAEKKEKGKVDAELNEIVEDRVISTVAFDTVLQR
ncbi:Myc-type basic helix-loop-helix (bHLH) domain [Trinorchestia longiramus]|nr:Myc-type basic helix-loop-helix (bHLH) domain [Trinorchestia longiramus]